MTGEQIIKGNKLIADYVGLKITYTKSLGWNGEEGDWDMEIEHPDFFDHDEQLMYLYDCDSPEEYFKFHNSWDWLMPVFDKIACYQYDDGAYAYPRTFGMKNEEGLYMVRLNRSQLFSANTLIEATHEAVVDFIKWYNNVKEPWE